MRARYVVPTARVWKHIPQAAPVTCRAVTPIRPSPIAADVHRAPAGLVAAASVATAAAVAAVAEGGAAAVALPAGLLALAAMVRKRLGATTARVMLTMWCRRHAARCAVLHWPRVGWPHGTVLARFAVPRLWGVSVSGRIHDNVLPSTTGTRTAACGGRCIAGTCRTSWLLLTGWPACRSWTHRSST